MRFNKPDNGKGDDNRVDDWNRYWNNFERIFGTTHTHNNTDTDTDEYTNAHTSKQDRTITKQTADIEALPTDDTPITNST